MRVYQRILSDLLIDSAFLLEVVIASTHQRFEADMKNRELRPSIVLEEKYELIRQVGSGSTAQVWCARAPNGSAVACKILHPHLRGNDQMVVRLQREAEILSRLAHPNIPRHVETSIHGDFAFLAMEFVDGLPLDEFLGQQTRRGLHFAGSEVRTIFVQLCGAITHAHQHGVIHRDLKPQNIMFSPQAENRVVKVLDFGHSRSEQGTVFEGTTHGRFQGSPLYMAPEQVNGQPATVASDVFTLATILFEILTLRRAWVRSEDNVPLPAYDEPAPLAWNNLPAILYRIALGPRPILGRLRPGLPSGLEDAFEKALSINPADRLSTVAEFHDAVWTELETLSEKPIPITEPTLPAVEPEDIDDVDPEWADNVSAGPTVKDSPGRPDPTEGPHTAKPDAPNGAEDPTCRRPEPPGLGDTFRIAYTPHVETEDPWLADERRKPSSKTSTDATDAASLTLDTDTDVTNVRNSEPLDDALLQDTTIFTGVSAPRPNSRPHEQHGTAKSATSAIVSPSVRQQGSYGPSEAAPDATPIAVFATATVSASPASCSAGRSSSPELVAASFVEGGPIPCATDGHDRPPRAEPRSSDVGPTTRIEYPSVSPPPPLIVHDPAPPASLVAAPAETLRRQELVSSFRLASPGNGTLHQRPNKDSIFRWLTGSGGVRAARHRSGLAMRSLPRHLRVRASVPLTQRHHDIDRARRRRRDLQWASICLGLALTGMLFGMWLNSSFPEDAGPPRVSPQAPHWADQDASDDVPLIRAPTTPSTARRLLEQPDSEQRIVPPPPP